MGKNSYNNHNGGNGVLVKQSSIQSFSGPLPHPDILLKFEEVVPGAADRIIKMAEEQSIHRKNLEERVVNSDISRSKWGQILGFIIAIVGLIVSGIISIYGSAVAGGVIGVGTLGSLVGVFMYGSKSRNSERDSKKNDSKNN